MIICTDCGYKINSSQGYNCKCDISIPKIRCALDVYNHWVYFFIGNKMIEYLPTSVVLREKEYNLFLWLSKYMHSEIALDSFDLAKLREKISEMVVD